MFILTKPPIMSNNHFQHPHRPLDGRDGTSGANGFSGFSGRSPDNHGQPYRSSQNGYRSRQPQEYPASDSQNILVIRNCSTKRVLQDLLEAFGGVEHLSGRYFLPACRDINKIRRFAAEHKLYVKTSIMSRVTILDVMVDRSQLEDPGVEPASGFLSSNPDSYYPDEAGQV